MIPFLNDSLVLSLRFQDQSFLARTFYNQEILDIPYIIYTYIYDVTYHFKLRQFNLASSSRLHWQLSRPLGSPNSSLHSTMPSVKTSRHPRIQRCQVQLARWKSTKKNHMVEGLHKDILQFLIKSNQGEVVVKNGRETKQIKIGDKTYNYDQDNPLTGLKKKLNTIKKTMEYKKFQLETKTDSRTIETNSEEVQGNSKRRAIRLQSLGQQLFHM